MPGASDEVLRALELLLRESNTDERVIAGTLAMARTERGRRTLIEWLEESLLLN